MQTSNIIWRIDDRLIHGQVIIGWCGQLPIKTLIVCDDEIAKMDWERDLLLLAAPPTIPTKILTSQDTIKELPKWIENNKIVMVLLKSPFELEKLVKAGLKIEKVNVGGIHFREDRKEFLPYLFLSPEEIRVFKNLINQGIYFECRDLPNSPSYDLKKILKKKNG